MEASGREYDRARLPRGGFAIGKQDAGPARREHPGGREADSAQASLHDNSLVGMKHMQVRRHVPKTW